ncbi:MAG TPA: phytanoyl-CoA dioxygenase family protein [Chloroflexota bacterium]|nr:phytanoyl-CoA dioxygenase family protein [Chloroflexota bacterium]
MTQAVVAVSTSVPSVAEEPGDGTFDGYAGGEYDPRLYLHRGLAETVPGFDSVTDAHLTQFREQGFLAIDGAFTLDEVQAALDGMLDVIDGKYPAYRGLQFEAGARPLLTTTPREQKQDLVRKLSHFTQHDARLHAIATHPKLLSLAERIIGDKPGIFEDKALIKPPKIGREKPWHQDHAYWNLPLDARIVTAWIALDAATEENGCLYVIPGSHREGPVVHFKRRDWQMCDDQVQTARVVAAPLKPGGVLLFDSYLQHGTPANSSHERRRALQFVYIPSTVGRITPAERLAVFGSEGKDVEC